MKRSFVWLALSGIVVGVAVRARRARAALPDGLRRSDDQFHAAYARRRAAAARAAPVLVLLGDTLTLFDADRRSDYSATAHATQTIKAAAHVPVGIFATLQALASRGARLDTEAKQRLIAMRHAQLANRAAEGGLDAETRADVEAVLNASMSLLERALARGCAPASELSQFAAQLGPLLLRLTEHATRLELAAMHAAVESALQTLAARDRAELEVVVAGVHQARARSLGLQYFQKRFGEAPEEERRVAYAEAASDVWQARELVGTRRLDRAIARAFFGDEKRLQRDVLGDAAARQLAHANFERLL
jgi:hypothetical protein